MTGFIELNNDQRRETVNTRQRFQAWRSAVDRERGYRGSMVWSETAGIRYLLRSYYDEKGNRRQKSLGRAAPETEELKRRFDADRDNAIVARKNADAVLERQAAINRVLGLGRVPFLTARILRRLDERGLMGRGLRVVGTNALYAYEAACGVMLDASLTTTEDVDPLFDARMRLHLIADEEIPSESLLQILRSVDHSFRRTRQTFRAQNDNGYLVDLIKPMTNPPWRNGKSSIGRSDDLEASEIEGLLWLENAPGFEQVAIDERGRPCVSSPATRAPLPSTSTGFRRSLRAIPSRERGTGGRRRSWRALSVTSSRTWPSIWTSFASCLGTWSFERWKSSTPDKPLPALDAT